LSEQNEGYVFLEDFRDMDDEDMEDFDFLKKPEKKRLMRMVKVEQEC
jgi:hypothetical protein